MTDFLTALGASGSIRLTKTFQGNANAEPKPYDDAKTFRHKQVAVSDIHTLAETLDRLRGQPQTCVVQGRVVAENDDKTIYRRLTHIVPAEHQWLVFDIDGFDAGFDARTDFKAAVSAWVEANLPSCFWAATHYCHLSSRAHLSSKLKAHVWFWLETPISNTVAYAWAKAQKRAGRDIDPVVYRTVQVIYTADPVFEGCSDPLAERSWLTEGFESAVSGFEPEFNAADMELLNHSGTWEFKDPTEKGGIIGAFCRTFTVDDLIDGILSEHFEWVNERRVTWLGSSSGAAEGCYVTDDRMHFGNTSGGSPHGDRTVNAFDMFRLYQFGHLDAALGDDWFGNESDLPSFRAAVDAAKAMPEVTANYREDEKAEEVLRDDFSEIKARIEEAATMDQAIRIAGEANITNLERSALVDVIAKRSKALLGATASKPEIKRAVAGVRASSVSQRAEDLQLRFARHVLDKVWGGGEHLRRFAKLFWLYDAGVWRPTEEDYVRACIHEAIKELKFERKDELEELYRLLEEAGQGHKALVDTIYGNIVNEVAADANADPLGLQVLDVGSVVNCCNGEVWFDEDGDLTFMRHDPRHMLTHQLATEYDPKAKSPEWDAAIERVFRDQSNPAEVTRHLYEVMGYLLQTSRSQAVWVLFHGNGSNGKTFVKDVLHYLLHRSAIDVRISTAEQDRHFEAGLVGKLLMCDDDFKKGALLPDDLLKRVSEAKPMSANPKNAAMFNFVVRSVPMILSNHWPQTTDTSDGLYRRAMVFDFNTTIREDEKDFNLAKRIRADEMPGILNHCIAGWQRVLKRGGKFDVPADCAGAKERWFNRANSLNAFVSESCEITRDSDDRVDGPVLYNAYMEWCAGANLRGLGRNQFYDAVSALRGVTGVSDAKHARKFFGLKLLVDPAFDFG